MQNKNQGLNEMLAKLAELLQVRRTRDELSVLMGVDDRSVRHYIALLSRKMPVLSLSCMGGYKIATLDDIEEVQHQIKENNSRAAKTLKRNEMLHKLLKGGAGA